MYYVLDYRLILFANLYYKRYTSNNILIRISLISFFLIDIFVILDYFVSMISYKVNNC